MYHRFDENKYPSTNIRNEIFLEHLNEINNSAKLNLLLLKNFKKLLKLIIAEKNYLLNN